MFRFRRSDLPQASLAAGSCSDPANGILGGRDAKAQGQTTSTARKAIQEEV
jgi:hypothetical protein